MKISSLLLSTLLIASAAGATEWTNYGARGMAMGGAGVALSAGAIGSYWNPAGLGQAENSSGLSIPLGVHAAVTGPVLEGANDLNAIQDDCQNGNAKGLCTDAKIQQALAKLDQPENGVRADTGVGVNLKIKRLVVFVNNFTYVSGKPIVDTANNNTGNIQSNQSSLRLTGISATEIGVGYGHDLPFFPGLLVGGNVKLISGRVGFYDSRVISQDSGESGNLDDFTKTDKKSVQPGFDLGALWDINKTFEFVPMRPRVGIVARNINNPKFDQPDQAKAAGMGDKFSLQGQTRVGAAISPLHFWNITADADLTNNLSVLEGVKSRMVGVGTEINVFNRTWLNIPVRAGLMRNVAEPGSKTSVTGGFGLNFLHLVIDAAVAVSPSRIVIQSEGEEKKIPSELSAGVQLGFQFGGGKEEKKKES